MKPIVMKTKQKRSRQIISMFLLATLLISLFVISDLKAVNAAEVLAVWVHLEDYPVEGEKLPVIYPENTGKLPLQGEARVKRAQWYITDKNGIYQVISENEKIVAGKEYYLGIEFEPWNKGDKFNFMETEFRAFHEEYPNPELDNKFGGPEGMTVYFKCTAVAAQEPEKQLLQEARVEGLEIPEVGKNPQFDVSKLVWDKSKFDVYKITWFDYEDDEYLTASDRFQEGREYEVKVYINPKNNYYIISGESYGYINSENTYGISSYDNKSNFAIYTSYKLFSPIKSIEISGVREPIDGEQPDKDIKKLTYDKKLFDIEKFTWEGVRDDGSYYNMGDEKFRLGEKYAATFIIDIPSLSSVNLSTNTSINGHQAIFSKYDNYDYQMKVIFTTKPQAGKTYIDKLNVILPDECLPVVGEEPVWDVSKYSLDNPPEGVSIKRVEWLKYHKPLQKGDKFEKDEKYVIGFFLNIPEKYVAKSGVTKAHVNSVATDFWVTQNGPVITYHLEPTDTPKKPKTPEKPKTPQQPQQPQQPGNQQYVMHFSDVMPSDWYYNYVKYVFENGIMNGVGDGKFAPKNNVSRAMIVTMLYRIAKEPAVGGSTNYNDNTGNTWYTNAVKWTAQKGLAKEFIQGNFDPNTLLTREQMITIMYNYQKSRGKSTALANSLGDFKDGYLVSHYAQDAMKWAVKSGIIQGNEQKKLNPTANVTRAEVAAIIQRFNNR